MYRRTTASIIRAIVLGVTIVGLLLAAPAFAAGPTTVGGLRASLNAQMAKAGARSGALVVDLSTGRTLYNVRSSTRLVPGSLEKLYTTSAALISLGPGGRLSTSVVGAGRRVGSTWMGDLYLRGSGDFTFGSASFNRLAYGGGGTLQALALQLGAQGVSQISGSVLGDASLFTDGVGPSSSLLFCRKPLFGPLCPYGPAGVFMRPLPNGPRGALTVDRGLVNRTSAHAQVHPALYAASQLTAQLRRAGIAVTGHPSVGRAPHSSRLLATTFSPAATQLAALTNRPSDNYAAEVLFRVLGARNAGTGSRTTGAAAVRRLLARRLGIQPLIYDGSGQSGRNRTSPRELVRLLVGMNRQSVARQFRNSLPVVGRSGTLANRLRGTVAAGRCQAMDGTLTGPRVANAAGYCRTVGGHMLAFAIMTKGVPTQDRMLTALAGLRAAPSTARLVLSPAPGQLVRSNSVGLRLQLPIGRYIVRVRLNGSAIQGSLAGRSSRVRTLNASISHGLRRGTNVLRVELLQGATIVRRATVRFKVSPTRPLVGAGRDRFVVVGQPVNLRGLIAGGAGSRLGSFKASSRWRVISGPRRAPGTKALPAASLRSPSGLTATFTPRALGHYVLQFGAGRGRSATADWVGFDVIPPSPIVDIDTMALKGSTPGITINGTFYGRAPHTNIQVLVLKRSTLEFVSNKSYGSTNGLPLELRALDNSNLVILAQRPDGRGINERGLGADLSRYLGFPDAGAMNSNQWWSGIGFVGMKPGSADVNIDSGQGGGDQGLKGYLGRDQNLEFTFIPSSQVPFSYGAPSPPLCSSNCSAGYRVRIQNARTLAVTSDKTYTTDEAQLGAAQSQAQAMLDDLNNTSGSDRLVTITTFSSRRADQSGFIPPLRTQNGSIAKATMNALADAIARLGGTHNAFNVTALGQGAPATGGLTYALIGWVGAGEGHGIESASGQHGASPDSPATLSGTFRPDNHSSYRPLEASDEPDVTNKLSQLVFSPQGKSVPESPASGCLPTSPGERWPLDNDLRAQLAIKYLTGTDSRLGDNARVAYWYAGGDQAFWDNVKNHMKDQAYPKDAGYSKATFDQAKDELVCEMDLVGRVRTFMTDLAKPFSTTTNWAETQKIAADVYEKSHEPEGSSTMSWLEFTNLLLEAGSPFTGHISGAIANFMKLGMWAFGENPDGSSSYSDFNVEASKLSAEVVMQAQTSVKTIQRMGDVIVSDYAKLSEVGSHANCLPRRDHPEACPEEFQSTPDDQQHMETAAKRAIMALAYEEFVPITWRVYELNGTAHAKPQFKKAPPAVNEYRCDVGYRAFYRYDDHSKATTSIVQDADPAGLDNNYITFAIAENPGHSQYATAPPEDILSTMFGPLSQSNVPEEGGLAINPKDFMSEAPHHAWWNGTIGNDPCWWGPVF